MFCSRLGRQWRRAVGVSFYMIVLMMRERLEQMSQIIRENLIWHKRTRRHGITRTIGKGSSSQMTKSL